MPRKIGNYESRDLEAVPLPTHGGRYTPITHKFVMDETSKQLAAHGFIIKDVQFKASDAGQVAQGVYLLQSEKDPHLGMMFCWTNSYNKTTKFRCAIGAYTKDTQSFVISNKIGSFVRKHTGTADQEAKQSIIDQISAADNYFDMLVADKSLMQDIIITKEQRGSILGTLFLDDLLSTHQMGLIRTRLATNSKDYEFHDTAWELYESIIFALQETHPRYWMANQSAIHAMLVATITSVTYQLSDTGLQKYIEAGNQLLNSEEIPTFVNNEVTEEATDTPNDLPWEDSSTTATSNYSMKGKAKTSKAEKFDAMFEDEE